MQQGNEGFAACEGIPRTRIVIVHISGKKRKVMLYSVFQYVEPSCLRSYTGLPTDSKLGTIINNRKTVSRLILETIIAGEGEAVSTPKLRTKIMSKRETVSRLKLGTIIIDIRVTTISTDENSEQVEWAITGKPTRSRYSSKSWLVTKLKITFLVHPFPSAVG